MNRILRALAASMTLALVLSGCYGDAESLAQDDIGPIDASAAPSEPGTTDDPDPEPEAEAEAGKYPLFEPTDYTYTLAVGCFCADGGTPISITVVAGEVTEAVYAGDGRGVQEGETAPDFREITINDVIAAANDPDVAFVDVTYADGQDYPSEVSIDRIAEAIDDEVTYFVSDVVVE